MTWTPGGTSTSATPTAERYQEFCAGRLAHLDEVVVEWVAGPDFYQLLIETVRSTFPAHEHDHFINHYRGLLAAWVRDEHGAH